ncbi:hypothetical protein P9480_09985 [Bacillus atrophaeus]|uniref:hypothetical protein n=1 Tax=Bacillus atrophaeus TaxID=1452 RepID=UPI002E1C20A4|nr:hypothetical protein [Bacillus atrophaeus]
MAKLEGVKTLDMMNGEITKVAYDGAAYERVEGSAQVSDLIMMKNDVRLDTTPGALYYVVSLDEGRAEILDDVDHLHTWTSGYYDLFRKVVAASKPSVEDRVAKAEGEIEALKTDVAALKGEADYKRIGKGEARAGDYVKFIETDDSSLTVGKMYEIVNIDYEGYLDFIDDDGDKNCGVSSEVFEVYRKVSAAEQKPHRQNGEIVRLRASGSEWSDAFPFRSERLDGTTGDIFGHKNLVRATDEEVAEAKRVVAEAAEHKKWAEIGREVGEYKEGDVVAYDDPNWFKNSGIGEVVGLSAGEPRVRAVNSRGNKLSYYLDPGKLRLVTPVEARFDR